jgi:hypothetical protein
MKRLVMAIMGLVLVVGVANAAQDGKGTNVFGHVRIKTDGTITFGGVSRTNWPTESTDNWSAVSNQVQTDITNLKAATNAHETAIGSKLNITNGVAVGLTVTGKFARAQGVIQEIVNNGDEIATTENYTRVKSATGSNELTVAVAAGTIAGQQIIIQGTEAADFVTITNNAGVVDLLEAVDFSLRTDNTLQLLWNGTKWIEIWRAAKE